MKEYLLFLASPMTDWSCRETEPLILTFSRMPATGGSNAEENADTSTQRASDSAMSKIFVQPVKFMDIQVTIVLIGLPSFERIARANEWAKSAIVTVLAKLPFQYM